MADAAADDHHILPDRHRAAQVVGAKERGRRWPGVGAGHSSYAGRRDAENMASSLGPQTLSVRSAQNVREDFHAHVFDHGLRGRRSPRGGKRIACTDIPPGAARLEDFGR
jgi:hypothetical protein